MKKTAKKTIRVPAMKLSATAPAQTKKVNEYEKDFFKWTTTQAKLLEKGEFAKLDIDHLREEIESLGINDKRALLSQTIVLLMHLLKLKYQPEGQGNSKSWDKSISNAKMEIRILIEDSPSLRNELTTIFPRAYKYAKQSAAEETGLKISTFPKDCPWEIKEILPFACKK
jgi:hypothetical protein